MTDATDIARAKHYVAEHDRICREAEEAAAQGRHALAQELLAHAQHELDLAELAMNGHEPNDGRPLRSPPPSPPRRGRTDTPRRIARVVEEERPFDPEVQYPREVKPHHFAVNKEWPLHGARDQEELWLVIRSLEKHRGKRDVVARETGVPQHVVAEIARWYQSAWMSPNTAQSVASALRTLEDIRSEELGDSSRLVQSQTLGALTTLRARARDPDSVSKRSAERALSQLDNILSEELHAAPQRVKSRKLDAILTLRAELIGYS